MDQRKRNKAVKKAVEAITATLEGLPDTEAMEEVVLEIYQKFVLVQNDRYELAGVVDGLPDGVVLDVTQMVNRMFD